MTMMFISLFVFGTIDIVELIRNKQKKDLIIFLIFFSITVIFIIFNYKMSSDYSFIESILNIKKVR